MNFVLLVIVGAAAGFLATRMMRIEAGLPATMAIGIGGAIIGGVLIRFLLEITGWMAGFVGAVLGALFLLWIWKTYIRGR
ncbi:MAG: GlsB/YeaQ/YmgE family stress response membrane protein [Pseudorhodobacter sp.]|nr:GlsB/YeaQ/YmgE family stress response membrane protein [Pseudorhodobacter sp.]